MIFPIQRPVFFLNLFLVLLCLLVSCHPAVFASTSHGALQHRLLFCSPSGACRRRDACCLAFLPPSRHCMPIVPRVVVSTTTTYPLHGYHSLPNRFTLHDKWLTKTTRRSIATPAPTPSSTTTSPTPGPITAVNNNTKPPITLNFWEHMICGATSRSLAKIVFHPANVAKTILQTSPNDVNLVALVRQQPAILWRGTAAQFVLSAIQGAVTFAIVEQTRNCMGQWWQQRQERKKQQSSSSSTSTTTTTTTATTAATLDFASSVVSTLAASIVSVPQMVLMDNLMVGNYPDLRTAVTILYTQHGGLGAFYRNWWPHLVGKIPAYALTWVFFQQLKLLHCRLNSDRTPSAVENTCMGFLASAASVVLMMPVEVVKTRMVTQSMAIPYRHMMDGFGRVIREEGWATLYRGLVPRLVSTVPMTGVNFGIYETLKRIYLETKTPRHLVMPSPATTKSQEEKEM